MTVDQSTLPRRIGWFLKQRVDSSTYAKLRDAYVVSQVLRERLTRFVVDRSYAVINTKGYPLKYKWDNVFTIKSGSFMYNPRFERAWALAQQRAGIGKRDMRWRAHVVCALGDMASRLEGDMVECGTYRGVFMHTLAEYLPVGKLNKTLYLCDTWTGMSTAHLFPWEQDRAIRQYADIFQEVKQAFAHVPNIRLVQGPVPDTLPGLRLDKICFLHLDMNSTFPEKGALEYFWDKLVPGGVVLSDDYGDVGYEGQRAMYDEFAAKQGLTLLSLPTGQGILFKPPAAPSR